MFITRLATMTDIFIINTFIQRHINKPFYYVVCLCHGTWIAFVIITVLGNHSRLLSDSNTFSRLDNRDLITRVIL